MMRTCFWRVVNYTPSKWHQSVCLNHKKKFITNTNLFGVCFVLLYVSIKRRHISYLEFYIYILQFYIYTIWSIPKSVIVFIYFNFFWGGGHLNITEMLHGHKFILSPGKRSTVSCNMRSYIIGEKLKITK